ncbi:hypothetical protein RRG08_026817, partial [Elysia crispata]
EAKNLPAASSASGGRNTCCAIKIDSEEIFRTSTVEKSRDALPTEPAMWHPHQAPDNRTHKATSRMIGVRAADLKTLMPRTLNSHVICSLIVKTKETISASHCTPSVFRSQDTAISLYLKRKPFNWRSYVLQETSATRIFLPKLSVAKPGLPNSILPFDKRVEFKSSSRHEDA